MIQSAHDVERKHISCIKIMLLFYMQSWENDMLCILHETENSVVAVHAQFNLY